MANKRVPGHSDLLHELAEGLQTTGTYLAAARRLIVGGNSGHASAIDVIEKAVDQLTRAQSAFHQLRTELPLHDVPSREDSRPTTSPDGPA